LRGVHIAAAVVVLLLFGIANVAVLWHTDIWYHLKFGQLVVEEGTIPSGDPFCQFGDAQSDLAAYAWLGQTTLYLVFQAGQWLAGGDALTQLAGGVDLLRLFHALTVALRFLVLFLAFHRLTQSWRLALLGLLLAGLLGLGHLGVLRPQVVGELLFALVLLTLSRPVLSNRALCLLPLLFVFWANWHAS